MKATNKHRRRCLFVGDDLWEKARAAAGQDARSVSAWVRQAMRAALPFASKSPKRK